ncbi:hypothetical protein [Streptomyces griseus]|uniref:hypothetical protein n=1 Tax=Streptomyces griseus TaxID=1911 RepID=UPI00099B9D34|nr:hypothetical protein [Streptomyces griseus]
MSTSPSARPSIPSTVWLARGRHTDSAAEDLVRPHLRRLKDDQVLQDCQELPDEESPGGRSVFEARWLVADTVTVRARLTLMDAPDTGPDTGREWTLVAEAERPWDQQWPSPHTMFWPEGQDAAPGRETVTGLRLADVNPLPTDEQDMRRVLRAAQRDGWNIDVVVHEAMTPDAVGRRTLTPFLPPGLRHRVVEHRASPHQLRAVNYALRDSGVEVPRGGAAVLPGTPAPPDSDGGDLTVRTVFLDGSEPTALVDAVRRFAGLPKPLPDGAQDALATLREDWRLLTLEEELARERRLVAMYAEALEAMTRSRDLYREAAERANEALAAYRESGGAADSPPPTPDGKPAASPLQQLTRTFERLKWRPAPSPSGTGEAKETPES